MSAREKGYVVCPVTLNFQLRPPLSLIVFCIVQLTMMLKIKPDITQPCLMPVSTVEWSDIRPSCNRWNRCTRAFTTPNSVQLSSFLFGSQPLLAVASSRFLPESSAGAFCRKPCRPESKDIPVVANRRITFLWNFGQESFPSFTRSCTLIEGVLVGIQKLMILGDFRASFKHFCTFVAFVASADKRFASFLDCKGPRIRLYSRGVAWHQSS